MNVRSNRGTVLVASLVILALLSLLGAGGLMNATLDTQLANNQTVGKEAFYASEAALEVGVGRIMNVFRQELRPFVPGAAANWTEPDPADGDPYANPLNGYTTEYRIVNALDPNNPGTEPTPYLFTTVENGQQLIHFAYTYAVEARATGTDGNAAMAETVKALETPLIQYYVFFEDDLSWHPGPQMISWGRIHTNGNLYFSPQAEVYFHDYDSEGNPSPFSITVHDEIIVNDYLAQANAVYPASGTLNRNSNNVWVRVRNIGSIPANPAVAPASNADYEDIESPPTAPATNPYGINASNQGAEEARFMDASGVYHVRVGVDRMPTPSFRTLERDGFYEVAADAPTRPEVDGMKIVADGGNLSVFLTPFETGVQEDVTDLVRNYWVDALGNSVDFATWPVGARTNADGSVVSAATPPTANAPPVGSIVYGPEAFVASDDAGNAYTAARGAGSNPWYPSVLEKPDGRENRQVDLTVIDLQRLQLWYRDYLDWSDNNAFDGSVNAGDRLLLIYASRSLSGGGFATGTGINALQAVKFIGSRAGRTRNNFGDRQESPTFVVNTTVATDNPVYFDGDFNAPGANAGAVGPGAFGSAVLCDAAVMISNAWGSDAQVFGQTGGTHNVNDYQANDTAYNTALVTGRYDFRQGGGGEEAGIHNFPRFNERWGSGVGCYITGCLINLWFSQQATGRHAWTNYYSPPARHFGWDVNFANQNYWPPYVPSIYSVERTAWRQQ